MSDWESMAADYATSGLTVHLHPLSLLRDSLPADAVTSLDLQRIAHGTRVKVAGLVVARQRPGTAGGIVFVLLEDEYGTINLIVPAQIYERHRLTVRTEPLMVVEGKLERFAAAGGSTNVLVDRVGSVAAPDRPLAEVKDFSLLDEQVRRGLAEQRGGEPPRQRRAVGQAADGPAPSALDDFRAVAPPALSFASGRRR
jgi:error-prone DNA polymerase